MVRKITSSINLQWAGGSFLLLGILNLTLESIVCSCKVICVSPVNSFINNFQYNKCYKFGVLMKILCFCNQRYLETYL